MHNGWDFVNLSSLVRTTKTPVSILVHINFYLSHTLSPILIPSTMVMNTHNAGRGGGWRRRSRPCPWTWRGREPGGAGGGRGGGGGRGRGGGRARGRRRGGGTQGQGDLTPQDAAAVPVVPPPTENNPTPEVMEVVPLDQALLVAFKSFLTRIGFSVDAIAQLLARGLSSMESLKEQDKSCLSDMCRCMSLNAAPLAYLEPP
jgi:hypothetical protein